MNLPQVDLPCGVFDQFQLDNSSSETFPFISSNCLSNRFVYGVHVAWITVASVTAAFSLLLLLYNLFSRRKIPSTIILVFSTLTHIGLALNNASDFVGLRGVPRMIFYVWPIACLVTGVTFLLMTWFRVVLATSSLKAHQHYESFLFVTFLGGNIVFHSVLWPLMLVSGIYDIKDPAMNNLFISLAMFWVGICGISISVFIYLLGRKLIQIISESGKVLGHQDSRAETDNIVPRVLRYSLFQSSIWLMGGIGAVSISIWGFATLHSPEGMKYFFYAMAFWLEPAMYFAGCLMIYAVFSHKLHHKSHFSTEESSKPSRTPASGILDSSSRVEDFVETMKMGK